MRLSTPPRSDNKIHNASGANGKKGASPLAIFTALFNLALHNKNLYQGIVKNKEIEVDKDAAYNFLNSPTYNWRRFIPHLRRRIYFIIRKLLDDSTYSRNRSKKAELLSRVLNHTDMKYIQKGLFSGG